MSISNPTEARQYIYGTSKDSDTFWKILGGVENNWEYIYCKKDGTPLFSIPGKYNWLASYRVLNQLVQYPLSKGEEYEEISPIIRKIRLMEKRFSKRKEVPTW